MAEPQREHANGVEGCRGVGASLEKAQCVPEDSTGVWQKIQ